MTIPSTSRPSGTDCRAEARVLVVVPVYNHPETLAAVVRGALAHAPVLVVDDGSMPPAADILGDLAEELLLARHETNQGKGAAILTAAREAEARGFTHIVTIDADGQHDPEEIPAFLEAVERNPAAIIVGARDFDTENVPGASRFGRAFSGFWLRVQTGRKLSDVQSGFRAYPVRALTALPLSQTRYAFEVEVLVRAAWAGLDLCDLPISVHYPERERRVSHFDVWRDNLRISLLNVRLTMRSFLPWPHARLDPEQAAEPFSLLHPLRSIRPLLRENPPRRIAASAAWGVFVNTLPLVGLRMPIILVGAGYMNLNRLAALGFAQLCIPPVVPALAILTGYWLRHGEMLTEYSVRTLGHQIWERALEYLIGACALALPLAALVGGAVLAMALAVQKGLAQS